jgi:SAM-dependent methyltransferase
MPWSGLGRNVFILVVSATLGLTLLHFHPNDNLAMTWSLLAAMVLFGLSIGLEIKYLPEKFKDLREDMAGASKAAGKNDILKAILEEILMRLKEDINNLRRCVYVVEEDAIPNLSVKTIQAVRKMAFATFVADEREHVYEDRQGELYLEAWYAKAHDLADKGDLHRVFIVAEMGKITDETVSLIEEHVERGVKVRVIERAKADDISEECETDFGMFDSNCVMTVTPRRGGTSDRLSVYVKGADGANAVLIDRYEKFKDRLLANAHSARDVLKEFRRPVNAHFWNNRLLKHTARLGPPHGLSEIDARKMIDLALPKSSSLRVAILGFTPQLVDLCIAEQRIREIVLVDQTSVAMEAPQTAKIVRSVRANWLDDAVKDVEEKDAFDVVFGDEALNNLTLPQYRTFFRAMQRMLKPNGMLILRTLGRYEDADRFLRAPAQQLLSYIRFAPEHEAEAERGARIIEYLHSTNIAFDEKRHLIETKRYNELLHTWIEQKDITKEKAEGFWFPAKDDPELVLSSPDTDQIGETSRAYFHQMPFNEIDPTYCGSDGMLRQYYRITPFVRRTSENGN